MSSVQSTDPESWFVATPTVVREAFGVELFGVELLGVEPLGVEPLGVEL